MSFARFFFFYKKEKSFKSLGVMVLLLHDNEATMTFSPNLFFLKKGSGINCSKGYMRNT